MSTATRSWVATLAYPGKAPVRFGTVMLRPDAPMHEVEAAIIHDAGKCLPDGFRIVDLVPGMLVFVPEET